MPWYVSRARSGISGIPSLKMNLFCSFVQSSRQFYSLTLPRVPWETGGSSARSGLRGWAGFPAAAALRTGSRFEGRARREEEASR